MIAYDREDIGHMIGVIKRTPATEYKRCRVVYLMTERDMSLRAAKIVVGCGLFGVGCIEGEVRAKVEAQKKKPTSLRDGLRVTGFRVLVGCN